MDESAKILLLGKTGAGKSSFVNYFLGKDVAKTGTGRPVTQDCFIPYVLENGRYPIEIIDTKGLEALDAYDQLAQISQRVLERNNSSDILNWFHTIFYCVSMATARFEPFEANLIRDMQNGLSQHIHIILTQCDTADPLVVQQMRDTISNMLGEMDGVEIFEVVSVRRKNRKGQVFEPYGREEISARVFDLLASDIADRLAGQYASRLYLSLHALLDNMFDELDGFVSTHINAGRVFSALLNDNVMAKIEEELDSAQERLDEEIEDSLRKAKAELNALLMPIGKLYASYYNTVVGDDLMHEVGLQDVDDIFSDSDLDCDLDIRLIMPAASKYINEDGDLIDESPGKAIGALFSGLADLLFIKKNFRSALEQMRSQMLGNLRPVSEIEKDAYERITRYLSLGL